jgi:hypothetical protein
MTDATPSGIRLSDWIAAAPIGKTASYALLRALNITPSKARWPGASAAVSMLDERQQQLMDQAAAALAAGRSIAEIATAIDRAPSRTPAAPVRPRTIANDQPQGAEPATTLPARLAAVRDALATGAALTTAEVGWLIGARPGAAVTVRGRLRAVRHARNCWTLEPAD